MRTRTKTEAERSIIFAGIIGNSSHSEINVRLNDAGFPPLPTSSYTMLVNSYKPYFEADLSRVGAAIKRPPPIGSL